MPQIEKKDLRYKDYSWEAVPGDDPSKTKEDSDRFSRHEGYEVLYLLNSLESANGGAPSIKTLQTVEWMIHEKLPSNIQGRSKVKQWIYSNYASLKDEAPF